MPSQHTAALPLKRKRSHSGPLPALWHALGLRRSLDMRTSLSLQQCTRNLSELVCYPRRTHDAGRTSDFHRLDASSFQFTMRVRRYLGRGAYYNTTWARGVLTSSDDSTGIKARIYAAPTYIVLLILMSISALVSITFWFVSILFIPLSLLIISIVLAHWWDLFHDCRSLYALIEQKLQDDAP